MLLNGTKRSICPENRDFKRMQYFSLTSPLELMHIVMLFENAHVFRYLVFITFMNFIHNARLIALKASAE